MSVLEVHPENYSQEEVQEILHMAIARKSDQGELTREQLREIAAELEIDEQSLAAAEQDWLKQKSLVQKKQEFNEYRKDILKQKAIKYVIVNGFLISINVIGAGTITWATYILLVWGIGLSLDTWKTFHVQGEAYEQAFQNWYRRQEVKKSLETIWEKIKKAWQS